MNIENTKSIINSINNNVTLVAVTKNQSIEDVNSLYNLGITDFGENKLQELVKKKQLFPNASWHFIGRIQSNKIKDIVKHSYLIHSVSELRYLEKINLEASKLDIIQDILIQLNVAGEESKKGMPLAEFEYVMSNQDTFSNVVVRGLMVMGDHVDDDNIIRSTFNTSKALFDKYETNTFNTLSMGMSGDYLLAIECGSTMVRIGTLLFKA